MAAPWRGLPTSPSGRYLVRTTWRDILDAATHVGRDPVPWRTAVPAPHLRHDPGPLAPLITYLCRVAHHSGPVPGACNLQPNVVYQHGTRGTSG
ncbi:hypothetical protein [Dactylosporangium darangshiense]|uniref:Uncharacterized protein n=1 Tax=Dactylosporangium darangshiense TaxID=579108 RepID=A0ABP8DNA0_9ACTN